MSDVAATDLVGSRVVVAVNRPERHEHERYSVPRWQDTYLATVRAVGMAGGSIILLVEVVEDMRLMDPLDKTAAGSLFRVTVGGGTVGGGTAVRVRVVTDTFRSPSHG
jgi:hypothetical protein